MRSGPSAREVSPLEEKRTELTMASLKGLKSKIDAGKIVQRRAMWADGYEAIEKRDGAYIYIHNFELDTCATWKEVYERAEPDAEGYKDSPEYLDTWELSPEPTEVEKARWQPLIDAFDAGEIETFQALVKEILVQQLEAALFLGQMRNPRVRKQMITHITLLRHTQ
jgi:hypothetical protein